MTLAEFLGLWPSSQLGWSRQISRDVHSRASERNRGNALARIPSGVILSLLVVNR